MPSAQGIRAGRAFVELFADDTKLTRGLKAAQRQLEAWGTSIQHVGKNLLKAGTAIVAPLLGAAKAWAESGTKMVLLSEKTGMAVESLSRLSYAASMSGVDMEDLEVGIKKMQKTLAEAAAGSISAQDTMAQLGLTIGQLKGLSPEQQFELIADRLSKIKSPAVRAQMAMQLFGRQGTAMLPMLADGAEGLKQWGDECDRLGLTMSTDSAEAAHRFEQALTRMWIVLKKITSVVGSIVAPVFEQWVNAFTEASGAIMRLIKDHAEAIRNVLRFGAVLLVAGGALVVLGMAVKWLGGAIGSLSIITKVLHGAFSLIFGALTILFNPFTLIIGLIGGCVAAMIYMTGKSGRLVNAISSGFAGLVDDVKDSLGAIGNAMAAGDLAAAAGVLWSLLKLEWAKGCAWLEGIWLELKWNLSEIWRSLWIGVAAVAIMTAAGLAMIWEDLCATFRMLWDSAVGLVKIGWARVGAWLGEAWLSLKMAWANICDFFVWAWANVVSGLQTVWAKFTASLEKAWNWMKGLVSDFDADAANKKVDEALGKRLQEIEAQKNIKISTNMQGTEDELKKLRDQRDAVENEYKANKQKISQETSDKLANREKQRQETQEKILNWGHDNLGDLGQHDHDERVRQRQEYDQKLKDAQQQVDSARQEWQDAVKKANDAKAPPPGKVKPQVKGDDLETMAHNVKVAGTFNTP